MPIVEFSDKGFSYSEAKKDIMEGKMFSERDSNSFLIAEVLSRLTLYVPASVEWMEKMERKQKGSGGGLGHLPDSSGDRTQRILNP